MSVTAVIAGQGALPALLVAALGARPHLVAEMEGCPADLPGAATIAHPEGAAA